MVVNSVEILKEIGFSEYEAKAYLMLIETNPLTAYEISKLSSVPSSKIYAVLNRLEEKNMVQTIEVDKKKRYVPLESSDFIRDQRQSFNNRLSILEENLKKIEKDQPLSYVWNIKGIEELGNKIRELLLQCNEELLISLWPQELKIYEEILEDLMNRGVNIAMVHYGPLERMIGQCYEHPIAETLFEEKGGRAFAMVCDSKVALMGTLDDHNEVEASWSRSIGFTSLAEDYIRHDIYIMKLVARFGDEMKKQFGNNYHLLRDVFTDREA